MPENVGGAVRAAVRFAPWGFAGALFFAAIGAIWWSFLDPASAQELDDAIVIQPGTAERVAAGDAPPFIPNTLSLPPGGELRVTNRDAVVHRINGRDVEPGDTIVVRAEEDEGEFLCSFHPGGALGFSVSGRGGLFLTAAVPALILGLPIGLLTGLVVAVVRRLGVGDAASAVP